MSEVERLIASARGHLANVRAHGNAEKNACMVLERAIDSLTAQHRLAALATVEPWKDHNGPLPDFDSPLACVFNSGVQYAVELLAKELGVAEWTPCDGTEDYDGDLGGTLMNIVCEAMPVDQHDECISPQDVGRYVRLVKRIAAWTDAEVAVASPLQVRHVARVVLEGADPVYPPFAETSPTTGAR